MWSCSENAIFIVVSGPPIENNEKSSNFTTHKVHFEGFGCVPLRTVFRYFCFVWFSCVIFLPFLFSMFFFVFSSLFFFLCSYLFFFFFFLLPCSFFLVLPSSLFISWLFILLIPPLSCSFVLICLTILHMFLLLLFFFLLHSSSYCYS